MQELPCSIADIAVVLDFRMTVTLFPGRWGALY